MDTFKFRVYCEVLQDGADKHDAANRLKLNLNDASAYIEDAGAEIIRQRKGCLDPVYPAQIARLVILDADFVDGKDDK